MCTKKMSKGYKLPNRVIEFILTCDINEFESLTIHKITKLFGVSRSYLFKTFKETMNFTLADFIKQQKMFLSAITLANDEKATVKWLSQKMGFCNSEYFINRFEEQFGITPGRYKQIQMEKAKSRIRPQNESTSIKKNTNRKKVGISVTLH
ncbi:MAG: helix-turn-helix transcriptional regulator [bacterium]|nr:helix-turn-helix transcriptional regulator [bacterium]